jgi:hypothetical protein
VTSSGVIAENAAGLHATEFIVPVATKGAAVPAHWMLKGPLKVGGLRVAKRLQIWFPPNEAVPWVPTRASMNLPGDTLLGLALPAPPSS